MKFYFTQIQSFEELVELASKGDPRKADQLTGDLKCKNHRDVDWYSLMPESHVVFRLGKLAEEKYDGKTSLHYLYTHSCVVD